MGRGKKIKVFILSFLTVLIVVGGGGVWLVGRAFSRVEHDGHFEGLIQEMEASMRERVRAENEAMEYFIQPSISIAAGEQSETEENTEEITPRPNAVNFVMVGLDHRRLADAIIVGSLHRDTGDINLMSIPRDMMVHLDEDGVSRLEATSRWGAVPQRLKINEVRALGGQVSGLDYMVYEIERMFGIEIDYHVEIRLDAFRRVVDAIGGVYFFVPVDMYYTDTAQNLFINLERGHQLLDGYAAEGLVRFRDSGGAGWNRDATQLQFIQAVFSQTLSPDGFLNNPLELINIVLSEVRTNAGLSAVRYIPLVPTIANGTINTYRLPGRGRIIDRLYFFVPDEDEAPDVIRQVFFIEG